MTSCSLWRSRHTPRPWLPSSGLTTTGKPIRRATRRRLLGGADRLLLGHRQAGRAEQTGGQVLVGGDVDRDRAGLRRHRGADALGVHALAELHQRVLVQADPRDVARDRLVDDRLGGGPEGGALGAQDEGVELGLEVEARVGLDEVVDQAGRQAAGLEADLLVDVPVDDVVAALLALDLPGLAATDVVADAPAGATARRARRRGRARCPRAGARRSRRGARASRSAPAGRGGTRAGAR